MFIYALTFLPMVLITLVVHELGHLIAARTFRIKVSGFQIGIGPTIFKVHTGNTHLIVTPSSLVPDLATKLPSVGETATIYAATRPDGRRTAAAIFPLAHYSLQPDVYIATHRQFHPDHLQLTGRVRSITQDEIVLADVCWSLKAIPIMAMVYLPEDPSRRIPRLYNTTSWKKQTIITFAGPLFNLLLFAAVILALAAIPPSGSPTPVLTVTQVTPSSPAALAGFQPGDRIIQTNTTLLPDHAGVSAALAANPTTTFQVHRGSKNLFIAVSPDPQTSLIGLTLAYHHQTSSTHATPPANSFINRAIGLTDLYIDSFAAFASNLSHPSDTPAIMGPLATAHYTAQAVKYAHLKAWLAILAAITITTALVNLVPMPPLDGYRIVLNTVHALRTKPINHRFEQAFMYAGFGFIAFAGAYLLIYDIILFLS